MNYLDILPPIRQQYVHRSLGIAPKLLLARCFFLNSNFPEFQLVGFPFSRTNGQNGLRANGISEKWEQSQSKFGKVFFLNRNQANGNPANTKFGIT